MPYNHPDPFVTGENEIVARLNESLRGNDALRADAGSLAEGDYQAHALDELHPEENASFANDVWHPLTTATSFRHNALPFTLAADTMNEGKLCFQTLNIPDPLDNPCLMQAQRITPSGCDVRWHDDGGGSFTVQIIMTHFVGV